MSDLIKRSDVLGYISRLNGCGLGKVKTLEYIRKYVERLPSADNEVIGKLKTEIENEEICKNCPTAERISGENLLGAMALGFSYGMEADRPQGEWIIHKINGIPHTAECSCCHNHYDYEDLRRIGRIKEIIALPYCPDCGANMKGAGDETD